MQQFEIKYSLPFEYPQVTFQQDDLFAHFDGLLGVAFEVLRCLVLCNFPPCILLLVHHHLPLDHFHFLIIAIILILTLSQRRCFYGRWLFLCLVRLLWIHISKGHVLQSATQCFHHLIHQDQLILLASHQFHQTQHHIILQHNQRFC